jgi:hypothetical protein
MNAVLIDCDGNPAILNLLTDITLNPNLPGNHKKERNRKGETVISASPCGLKKDRKITKDLLPFVKVPRI